MTRVASQRGCRAHAIPIHNGYRAGHRDLPRPFMVKRGHNDWVSRDPWAAQEYARVRWLYTRLGLGDKTEIEYFNGGHTINGDRTFRFLHKHLNWPEPG